jgi:hypothetical protein
VIVDIGGERRGDGVEGFDAGDKRVVNDGAVFQAKARISAGSFALEAFVNAERDIDADVSVGVRADLPVGRCALRPYV